MDRWAPVLVVTLATACSGPPDLSEQQQRELFVRAVELLNASTHGSVSKENWKESIAVLKPESVLVTNEGLYIKTESFFATERGFFVPRPATVVNGSHGTEPSYKKLGNGIYRYEI